jgi:serralysin
MHWLVRIGLLPALVLLSSVRLDCVAAPAAVGSPRIAGRTLAAEPRPVQYTTDDGDHLLLFAWAGNHIAFLTPSADLEPQVMAQLLTVFDKVYDYYSKATGRQPTKFRTFAGRDTIAVVKKTCGAGCSYLGFTGIELLESTFETLYTGVRDRDEFDQVLFYEFGRNFWFYDAQIQYRPPADQSSVATGYAVFMRFMAMDAARVRPGPYNDIDFGFFRSTVEGLVHQYEADPRLNWDNTLRVGKAPGNPLGLQGTDLFASFLMRLTGVFGLRFASHLWLEVAARPAAATTQDALDNLVLAACSAAGSNLTEVFAERWRWPLSAAAKEEARSRFGKPIEPL